MLDQVVQVDKPYKGSGKKWEMPTKDDNYHRNLQDKPWRNTLKPLNIDQPEGPSFQVLKTCCNGGQDSKACNAFTLAGCAFTGRLYFSHHTSATIP